MIRTRRPFDMQAVSQMATALEELADQHVSTDYDSVEPSPVTGTYDWRAYLQDELAEAQRREAQRERTKQPEKRPAPKQSAAPSVFYA